MPGQDGITNRQRDRQMHELKTSLLASGVHTSKRTLEARAFTFGGTEGSMLGRRGWFDAETKRFEAGKKGMIQCCYKKMVQC
jgi:hypothetical protein